VLYIFPTKALVQDQLKTMLEMTHQGKSMDGRVKPLVLWFLKRVGGGAH
jgi:ATP-dependent helicase YprA (DUF1998 family)